MEIKDLVKKVLRYNKNADIELINKAYKFSENKLEEKKRASGKKWAEHYLEVADLLAEAKADDNTICCALMHGLLNKGVEEKEIKKEFGENILELLKNIELMTEIKKNIIKQEYEKEGLRKVLLAASKDIRALLIKLCDKLINMRELDFLEEKERNRIAKETMEVYAPLAYRLGMGKIKAELEDLAFRHLEPEKYKDIENKVEKLREFEEHRIYKIKKLIENKINKEGIKAEVYGRVKQIYSIYKKALEKEEFKDVWYDVIAIRIITENVEECYNSLRIVHTTFRHIPARFKDYIALPKPNGYQSIHTTIIDEDNSLVEVQIRTREMHELAEEGIASHFSYKGITQSKDFDKKMIWMKQLLQDESAKNFDINFFGDEIFVFTPKGKTVELPKGSTPIDFAYYLHTDLGRTCVGAKINGKIEALETELQNGDVVEIITSKSHTPSIDWLKLVRTNKAKEKIKQEIKNKKGIIVNISRNNEEIIEEATIGLIKIQSLKGKKAKLAQCCNPLPGDQIEGALAGFKTVNVHKKQCENLKKIKKNKCKVEWINPKNEYIELVVKGEDRTGIFAEILNTAASIKIQIKNAKGKEVNKNLAEFRFGFDPESLEQVIELINRIKKIKGTKNVYIKIN